MNKRILLAGGGTGGPVTPLLAVAAELKNSDPGFEFLLVGMPDSPERKMAESAGIRFTPLRAARLRRYFSIKNFLDIFVFFGSLFSAWRIISEFKPAVIFSACGFVSVPLAWVGKLKGVKVIVHQQDAQISLTYKLISLVADNSTCVFPETAKEMKPGTIVVGNPVRKQFDTPLNPDFKKRVGLKENMPLIFIVGGATGAAQINSEISKGLDKLAAKYQIVHVTGKGKQIISSQHVNYFPYEFLTDDYPEYMKAADLVISRAGLASMAELSILSKPSIIVPMPKSHQEINGELLKAKNAAIILNESEFNASRLITEVDRLMTDANLRQTISSNIKNIMPHGAAGKIAEIIKQYAN